MVHRLPVVDRSPAVFVFDPANGQLVSQNASAGELLRTLNWPEGDAPTLSGIEKRVAGGGKVLTIPQRRENPEEQSFELKRRCRRPDGSEFILTRIWTPGSSTTLIAADITRQVQEERQLRFAQAVIDRVMRSRSLQDALDAVLRLILLYAGWQNGSIWLPKEGELLMRLARPATAKSEETAALAAEAWQTGELLYRNRMTAIPLKAHDEIVGVLCFNFTKEKPRDQLTLDVLDSASEQLGMALKCRVSGEEMRNANHQLDELLAAAGDAIVSMGSDHRIRLFNRQAEAIFGYSASEVMGRDLSILLPESVQAGHRAKVTRFARSEAATQLMGGRPEIMGRRKDGSEFPAEASISKMVIEGEIVFTAVVRDLTSLRQAEEALRSRERQMRMMVEAMPYGLAIARQSTGELVFCNSAFASLVGIDADALGGCHFSDFMSGGLDAGAMAVRAVDGRVAGFEAPMKTADGHELWCMVSAVAMTMGGDDVTMIGCYDVTDRHLAITALHQSAYNLAEAERIAHLGHWIWQIEPNSLQWSDETYRLFGLEPQCIEMTYPIFLEHVHPDDRDLVEEAVANAIKDGGGYKVEHRIVLPDGTVKFVLEQAEIECDGRGRPFRMRGTVFDTTAINRATEELQAARNRAECANRAKSQFLANMSHELRTPLNAIIGFSELMAGELLGPMTDKQYKSYAQDINDSGHHLLAIVNDILDLSRIEAGAAGLDETEIEIAEVCANCIKTVQGRADFAGLTLRQVIQPALPLLHGDKRLVTQILLNLLSNAIKFTPAGGSVVLRAEQEGDGAIRLSVEDTGIGIAHENLVRVTEPFMQVESHLSRSYEGVGLGLALTKQFVELHGGELQIESEEGRGTCVDIRFPPARSSRSQVNMPAAAAR
ncbi:PAS domain S-box protein [Parvibaculum sp.]|uniref:PAS domain S-box protein n=1 Tax=Parvibaculum sp. TaxID=2024848 RepID=UPI00391BF41B